MKQILKQSAAYEEWLLCFCCDSIADCVIEINLFPASVDNAPSLPQTVPSAVEHLVTSLVASASQLNKRGLAENEGQKLMSDVV